MPSYELLLVSQSPRRRELLSAAGYFFRADSVKVSELIDKNVNLSTAIQQVAETKAQAYLEQHKSLKGQPILILSADTVVALGAQVLGKPENQTEACRFLQQLSGVEHSVITGITIFNLATGEQFAGYDESKVKFKNLTAKEITEYVATGEPMDKAGAYAIQGEGRKLVANFSGSWSNIVGLPMELLERVLREKNWQVPRQ
jgi:septum formation protein